MPGAEGCGRYTLHRGQRARQAPSSGEVCSEQATIGVNPLDINQRIGDVPTTLPSPLGLEDAGMSKAQRVASAMMKKDLDAGALLRVLPQWQLDRDAGVYFVRTGARVNSATTMAFKH